MLPDGVQADPQRLRVGTPEQGYREQPQGLPALALRESADAAIRPLPRLLHDPRTGIVELQLHG